MAEETKRPRRRRSVIDIVVVIAVLCAVIFGVYKFVQWRRGDTGEKVQIVYTVRAEGLSPETYEQVLQYIPSDIIESGERQDGRVTGVEKLPHLIAASSDETGSEWVEDPYHIDLLFTLEATVTESGSAWRTSVGTQEVRVGRIYTVETEYFEIDGNIQSVDRPES